MSGLSGFIKTAIAAGVARVTRDPITGRTKTYQNGVPIDNRLAVGASLVLPFERSPAGAVDILTLPNPYPAQANAPVHPSLLFFPAGWNGLRYWLAFTPYPGYNSVYENPCVVASNDFEAWVSPATNPLIEKPAGGAYNADTHLFMSADNVTMYLAFRERGVADQNHLKIMHSTDGKTWSVPVAVHSGAVGVQDFASPSIWWNGTGWTMLSHNLDAAAPWPIQRRVSATADVYGAWGAATVVTAPPAAGRAWWHSFAMRTGSGQVLALLQDNHQAVGASGTLYVAESGDDGVTFGAFRQIYTANSKYRSSFCLETVDAAQQMRVVVSDFVALRLDTFILRGSRLDGVSAFTDRARAIMGTATLALSGTKWADTFSRADNAATVGAADSGGAYTVSSGTWGISGKAAYPVTNGRLLVSVGVSAYRAAVQFLDMMTGVQQWLIFRAVDGTNYWRIGCDSPLASGASQLKLQSVVAGAVVVNALIGAIERGQFISVDTFPGGFAIHLDGVLQHERVDGLHGNSVQIGIQANAGANTKYKHLFCEAL